MPERKVHGSYKRSVSDGNYGTEGAEVTFEWTFDDDEDSDVARDIAVSLLDDACEIVLLQLRRSLSPAVRRTVTPNPPKPTTPTRAAPTAPAEDVEDLPF